MAGQRLLSPVSFLHGLGLSVYKEPEKVSASSVSDESLYDVLFLYRGYSVCFAERLWKSQYFSLHVFGRRAYQHSGAISEGSEKGAVLLGAIAFVQLLYFLMPNIIPFTRNLSGDLLTGIVPNLALNEYGFSFVALGVLMYFLKEKKDLFCVMYILFCISQFSIEMFESGGIGATQWLMVLVLPLMLGYNNQKGPGMKYFFYIFYPAHTFLLFYLAEFVFQ